MSDDRFSQASRSPELEAEAELVDRIRAGDESACATLVRRHGGAMMACARRILHCEAESADAVQDALVSAFRSIGSFAGNARLGTWLHRIVVNACLVRLRARRRRRAVPLDDLLPTFDESGRPASRLAGDGARQPLARLEREEVRAQVRACIDRLPDPHRTVLLLRDIEEFDTDQTAELLGTSRGAVKVRLHRARQALRSLLAPLLGLDGNPTVENEMGADLDGG
ncbi:MAG: sigma-70 family RNA polymerase sigma factor [Planctomycetes bacterium]|nr:sigma-70 family RNA polymerase sigma factor [Planctomycetota bacterium]